MNWSADPKQGTDEPSSEYRANLEILMEVPLFVGLPLEPLKVLAYLCTREVFKAEEILFRAQELDANAYFILEGEATLVMEDGASERLTTFGPGDFIGGLALFGEMKRLFTLKAATRVTCLMLSREKFRRTLERFPELGLKMFENMARRIHEWEQRFVTDHLHECLTCRSMMGVSLL